MRRLASGWGHIGTRARYPSTVAFMIKALASFRHAALLIVLMSFVSAALLLYTGSVKVGKAIWLYSQGQANIVRVGDELKSLSHLSQEDGVTGRIIESLDTFLIAAVLIYFGYGIYALYCARRDDPLLAQLPPAIVPASLGELKHTLGQIILVVLMVLFTRQVWMELDALRWEHLVIPGGVLLLGAGMRLSGIGKHS